MSTNTPTPISAASAPQRRRPPEIRLPDGDTLVPRRQFAEQELGVVERTLARLNPPTVYVGNVAYIARNATLQLIAKSIRRRNQPPVKAHKAARKLRRSV